MGNYLGYSPQSDAVYRKRARDIVHRLFKDVQDGQFMVFNGTYRGITGKWAVSVHPEWIHIPGRLFHSYDYQFRDRSYVGMILITTRPKDRSTVSEARYMHGTPVFETTPEQLEDYDVFEEFNAFPDDKQPLVGKGHNSLEYQTALAAVRNVVAFQLEEAPKFDDIADPAQKLLVEVQSGLTLLENPDAYVKDAGKTLISTLKSIRRETIIAVLAISAADALYALYHWGQHMLLP